MALIPPLSTIGFLGGGQLGRMMALAATELGYRTHVFTPENDSPLSHVASATTLADYSDEAALARFADAIDVVTFEFENVPVAAVEFLARLVPARPGARSLATCQDRLAEKTFVNSLGVATAPFASVESLAELDAALRQFGLPAILKTRRFGYDGKGQVKIDRPDQGGEAFAEMRGMAAVLEGFVPFEREISVIVARSTTGEIASYPAVENRHVHHILDQTIAPADLPARVAAEAVAIAEKIIGALDYVGVLAVELFLLGDGTLVVNELAPRVHNSGHWTIEAAATSQFEQHVRAICGLPLGSVALHADAVMKNLIGDEANAWPRILAEPNAHLHLYGKAEARPGRKMGHVTRLYPVGYNRQP